MNDVFVSYAREDRPFTARLVEALTFLEISVWWDLRIEPGKDFAKTTEAELARSRCVVVLWSEQSLRSTWVHNEVRRGLERAVVIPILIEEVGLPLEFSNLEAISLVGWTGDVADEGFCKLVAAIPPRQASPHGDSVEPVARTIARAHPKKRQLRTILGVAAVPLALTAIVHMTRSPTPSAPPTLAFDAAAPVAPVAPVAPDAGRSVEPPQPQVKTGADSGAPAPPPPKKCCDETGNVQACAKARCSECSNLRNCP